MATKNFSHASAATILNSAQIQLYRLQNDDDVIYFYKLNKLLKNDLKVKKVKAEIMHTPISGDG
ncbi:hypothetical protein T10_13256 [Trichinella papuae]|uniref:Uncharacterized protein n=1 Tax=Trichinella papuae TaxID=268474 RepID=A0A0V1MDT8_9BILA|nr:hypothetical protein T10_13256 [Trichinella papuae]